MSRILTFVLIFLSINPCFSYVDTTPSNFKKPKPIQVKPYSYHQSKMQIYTEKAVEQVVPLMLGGVVTGPARVIELGNKALEYSAKQKNSN
ncbi:MAG: hypothetical protein HRT47_00990 [Candidatus Caenarcaniphilales bacterium]|nr:hypothetical protein [Candidatus Caenarcaniphilales bacterium]